MSPTTILEPVVLEVRLNPRYVPVLAGEVDQKYALAPDPVMELGQSYGLLPNPVAELVQSYESIRLNFDKFFSNFLVQVATRQILWDTYDCYIMLLDDLYDTTNTATHTFVSDVIAWEVEGAGYTSLGKSLITAGSGWVKDAGAQTVSLITTADPEWQNSTIAARYAVIYASRESTPVAATSPLIALLDLEDLRVTAGGTFYVPFDPSGVVLQVNGGAGDIGYQENVRLAFTGAYTTPFTTTAARAMDLLTDVYTPNYEIHKDDASTYLYSIADFGVGSLFGLEGEEFVYRKTSGSQLITNFSGTFRYILIMRGTDGTLGTCYDLGSNQEVVSSDLLLTFPDGVLKFVPVVEGA